MLFVFCSKKACIRSPPDRRCSSCFCSKKACIRRPPDRRSCSSPACPEPAPQRPAHSPTSRASLSSQRAPKAPAGWVSWPSCGGRHDLAQDCDTLHGGLPFRLLAWKIKNRSRISSCRGRHSVTLGHATLSQSGQVPAPGYTDQDLWRSASEPSILYKRYNSATREPIDNININERAYRHNDVSTLDNIYP